MAHYYKGKDRCTEMVIREANPWNDYSTFRCPRKQMKGSKKELCKTHHLLLEKK